MSFYKNLGCDIIDKISKYISIKNTYLVIDNMICNYSDNSIDIYFKAYFEDSYSRYCRLYISSLLKYCSRHNINIINDVEGIGITSVWDNGLWDMNLKMRRTQENEKKYSGIINYKNNDYIFIYIMFDDKGKIISNIK